MENLYQQLFLSVLVFKLLVIEMTMITDCVPEREHFNPTIISMRHLKGLMHIPPVFSPALISLVNVSYLGSKNVHHRLCA